MLAINLSLPEAQVRVPDELDPGEGEDAVEDGLWLHPEHQRRRELKLFDFSTTSNTQYCISNNSVLFLS